MKKIFTLFLLLSITILFLSGCGTTGKFVYPASMRNLIKIKESKFTDKTIAVLPFDNLCSDKNTLTPRLLAYVPLFPYGWNEYSRPGAARDFLTIREFDFDASEDLSKAAALSLRRSKMFKDAWFTFGGDKHRADYILKGEIISTTFEGHMYTYGLSVFSSILWFIGAPVGTAKNSLAIKFSLHDKNDQTLWSYSFNKSDYIWIWLYYRMGHDVRMYPKLMEQAMNEAILNMNKNLKLKK